MKRFIFLLSLIMVMTVDVPAYDQVDAAVAVANVGDMSTAQITDSGYMTADLMSARTDRVSNDKYNSGSESHKHLCRSGRSDSCNGCHSGADELVIYGPGEFMRGDIVSRFYSRLPVYRL